MTSIKIGEQMFLGMMGIMCIMCLPLIIVMVPVWCLGWSIEKMLDRWGWEF